DCPGGRLSYEEVPAHNIRQFARIGFRLFQLDIWLDDMWFEDGTFDISMARKQIKGVTDICPDGKVFLRFHTTPPKWWNHQNADQLVDYADTMATPEKELPGPQRYLIQDLDPVYRHSFASWKWLDDSTRMLIRFLDGMSRTPEGKSLAGIQPATGVYGEHHYWAFMNHEPDTGIQMQNAFRRYLKDKYGTDKRLQAAWGNPAAAIAASTVPGMEERMNNRDGIFRDPVKERNMIDYYDCQHRLVADSVVHFCRVIKESWPSPIITGAFYGYYTSVFGRAAAGGHLCEQTILNSPYVDCMCAPQAYDGNQRQLGGAGASRGMLESAFLHGKLWLDEMDQPVHTGTVMGGMPVYGVNESKQILRRNTMFPILNGGGLWYYDFGPYNNSGWWTHKVYEDEISALKETIEACRMKQHDNPADVLLVFDTEVFKYTAYNSKRDPITDAACINTSYTMALRSGVAVDSIYLSDLEIADISRYKCIVFMNAFVLTPGQRAFISDKVCADGRHVLWFYAPGYIDGSTAGVSNIKESTGLDIEKVANRRVPSVKADGVEFDLYELYEKLYESPSSYPSVDLFVAKAKGKPSIICEKRGDGTVWFSPVPFTAFSLFTRVFRESGAHIYCDEGDSMVAGAGILSIHTKDGGRRKINLRNGGVLETGLDPAETILIDYNSGKILHRG
ncbi:MAG: hypothetical protein JXB33_02860, partial [Clostridia bacterium]|nr:hypothetical protein [Clostridia bacterium]